MSASIMWENFAFTIAGILIGGLAGHRLALGRDKRVEFNEIVRPVYVDLVSQLSCVEQGSANIQINFRAIEEAKTLLPPKKQIALSNAILEYNNLMSSGWEPIGAGASEFKTDLYPNLADVLKRLSNLLRPK